MNRIRQNRWGEEEPKEQLNLLERKDQQIRRLQGEVQEEKRRADNAIKVLDSFRAIKFSGKDQAEQNEELTRRIKAEAEVVRLTLRNKELEQGISKYLAQIQSQFDS